jgi:uncharacterized membrane protein
MHQKIMLNVFVFLFVIGIMSYEPLGMVRLDEVVRAGDELAVHVNTVNEGDDELDNVKITVYIPDLEIIARSRNFDLGDGEKQGRWLFIDIPEDAQPGHYPVKITVKGDRFRSVKYTWFSLI